MAGIFLLSSRNYELFFTLNYKKNLNQRLINAYYLVFIGFNSKKKDQKTWLTAGLELGTYCMQSEYETHYSKETNHSKSVFIRFKICIILILTEKSNCWVLK